MSQIEHLWASPSEYGNSCPSAGKESACNAGDLGSIPRLARSPGEGKGYPLQYSGMENSIDCIVRGVAKSQTWLSDFHSSDKVLTLSLEHNPKGSTNYVEKKKKRSLLSVSSQLVIKGDRQVSFSRLCLNISVSSQIQTNSNRSLNKRLFSTVTTLKALDSE